MLGIEKLHEFSVTGALTVQFQTIENCLRPLSKELVRGLYVLNYLAWQAR